MVQGMRSTRGPSEAHLAETAAEGALHTSINESSVKERELDEFADIPEHELTAAQLQLIAIIKAQAKRDQKFHDVYRKVRTIDRSNRVASRIESYVKDKE